MVPHTVIVDFAVALLFTSVLCDALAAVAEERDLTVVASWLLTFGSIAAALAALSGYSAASAAAPTGRALETINWHRNLGIATLSCFAPVAVWRLLAGGRPPTRLSALYWGLTALGTALLAITAYLGGTAVFRFGVGVAAG